MKVPSFVAAVRPWLVVIGIVFALVGGALIGSAFYIPNAPSVTQTKQLSAAVNPGPGQEWPFVFGGTSPSTVSVDWTASNGANVSFWSAAPCSSGKSLCPVGGALVSWTGAATGHWSLPGASGSDYLLSISTATPSGLVFNGTVSATYVAPHSSLGIPTILVVVGGVLLLAVGAIALFLGLFLPSGVYARVERYEELAEGTEPAPPRNSG